MIFPEEVGAADTEPKARERIEREVRKACILGRLLRRRLTRFRGKEKRDWKMMGIKRFLKNASFISLLDHCPPRWREDGRSSSSETKAKGDLIRCTWPIWKVSFSDSRSNLSFRDLPTLLRRAERGVELSELNDPQDLEKSKIYASCIMLCSCCLPRSTCCKERLTPPFPT